MHIAIERIVRVLKDEMDDKQRVNISNLSPDYTDDTHTEADEERYYYSYWMRWKGMRCDGKG